MDRLLIFGSGFLVKYISEYFIKQHFEVRVIYNKHIVEELSINFQLKKQSVDVKELLQDFRPKYLLFATGDSFVSDNLNINQSIERNLIFTLNELEDVLRFAKNVNSIERIVIIGSAAEYGRKFEDAIPESTSLHPTSIYGLTKIFLYNTAMYYAEKGLPIVYARQFNAVGPYQRDVFVLSSFAKQIAMIEKGLQSPKMEVGNLSAERDFVDVRDAAKAYYLLFMKGLVGHTYNIGSGTSVRISELLNLLLEQSRVEKTQIQIIHTKLVPLSTQTLADKLLSDIRKLKGLGFELEYSLMDTVKDTLKYWRNNV